MTADDTAPAGCRRVLALLMACAATACSATTRPARREAPVQTLPVADTAPYVPAGINVSGTWATGATAEPAVRRVMLQAECNATPALWLLQQDGDSVRLFTFAPFHGQGVPSSPVSTNVAQGRVSGLNVTMTGPGARFVLRVDTTSGHLRGTLNGASFWAVPLDLVRAENCVAIP